MKLKPHDLPVAHGPDVGRPSRNLGAALLPLKSSDADPDDLLTEVDDLLFLELDLSKDLEHFLEKLLQALSTAQHGRVQKALGPIELGLRVKQVKSRRDVALVERVH